MLYNLKRLRTSAGISQKALAEALDISQQSINKYENHNIEPDINTLTAIADYFHVSIDYLVGHCASEECTDSSYTAYTPEIQQMLHRFNQLTAGQKRIVNEIINSYTETKK